MLTIQSLFAHQLTSLTSQDLKDIQIVSTGVFNNQSNLTSVDLPDTVKAVENYAFQKCPIDSLHLPSSLESVGIASFEGCKSQKLSLPKSLMTIGYNAFEGSNYTEIDIEKLSPQCQTGGDLFGWQSPWVKSHVPQVAANGQLLIGFSGTSDFKEAIPSTVTILGSRCLEYPLLDASPKDLVSYVIPDHIKSIRDMIFTGQYNLAQLVVGSGVTEIGKELIPKYASGVNIKTIVFRQPANLEVKLPSPGSGTGMAYQKSSSSITVYTDNKSIRNYDWSKDNLTVTFKPLSGAPTITTTTTS